MLVENPGSLIASRDPSAKTSVPNAAGTVTE
jgi:hypothetical protein